MSIIGKSTHTKGAHGRRTSSVEEDEGFCDSNSGDKIPLTSEPHSKNDAETPCVNGSKRKKVSFKSDVDEIPILEPKDESITNPQSSNDVGSADKQYLPPIHSVSSILQPADETEIGNKDHHSKPSKPNSKPSKRHNDKSHTSKSRKAKSKVATDDNNEKKNNETRATDKKKNQKI